MNLSVPKNDRDENPRATPTMKFTYPSGSTPLSGYTIKRGVGRGGFGEVYFGTSDAGKEVALKLIRRNLEVELRGVKHCLNLSHPNLISLYDIRTDEEGDQWVIMEYVSGLSLDRDLASHPTGLSEEKVLWWMHGLAAGVGYLHEHGIVHRDLKPGNIFANEKIVKIGDYGLSKFISCSHRSGQTESVGTVHYMAPEIANGRYGREIDIYALGIMLFEMLTGKVPFEGESVGEVLMKHLTAEPDLEVLHEPYREIVRRALTKDPELRIKTVSELVAMLPNVAGGPGNVPTNSSTPPPLPFNSHNENGHLNNNLNNGASGDNAAAENAANQNQPLGNNAFDGAVSSAGFYTRHGVPTQEMKPEKQNAETHQNNQTASAPASTNAPKEPIAQAIGEAWYSLNETWEKSELPALGKLLLFIGLVVALVATSQVWISLLLLAIPIYLVYYVIWILITPNSSSLDQTASAQTGPHQSAKKSIKTHPQKPRINRNAWRPIIEKQLEEKTLRVRITELLGAMIFSAMLVIFSATLLVPLISEPGQAAATALWYSILCTLSAWSVLIPAKLIEGRFEEGAPRRIIQAVLGCLLGLVAYSLIGLIFDPTAAYTAGLPYAQDFTISPHDTITQGLINYPGRQTNGLITAHFTIYFTLVMFAIGWWKQTDFTRKKRFSFGTLLWVGLLAWAAQAVTFFPQPAGIIFAVITSLAVQFASPWLGHKKRRLLCEKAAK